MDDSFVVQKITNREYSYVISHKQETLVSWCLYSIGGM